MGRKLSNKTIQIQKYLAKHPEHTWKNAQPDLEKYGINGTYFSNQKGKIKAALAEANEMNGSAPDGGEATAAKSAKMAMKKKPGRKPNATSSKAAPDKLTATVEFARSVGGIDDAKQLLEQLSNMQV